MPLFASPSERMERRPRARYEANSRSVLGMTWHASVGIAPQCQHASTRSLKALMWLRVAAEKAAVLAADVRCFPRLEDGECGGGGSMNLDLIGEDGDAGPWC